MVVLLVIGLLLAGVLAYLLFAPIVLEIDTPRRWYGLHYGPALDARLVVDHLADPRFVLRFWRWQWRWSLLSKRTPKPASPKAAPSPQPKRRRRLGLPRMLKLLRTFHVRRFRLTMDTDDYVLNAYLFPIATWLTARGWPVSVNFMRQNQLELQIENRAGRLLWAFITST